MAYTNEYSPTLYSDKDIAETGSDAKKLKGSDFSDGTNGDFDRIRAEFVKIQTALAELGTTRGLFASCTFKGGSGPIDPTQTNNVSSVTWVDQVQEGQPTWKFCRVEFANPLDGSAEYPANPSNGTLDANVNIQVTPFSNTNPFNSMGFAGFVNATVTNIDKDGCEIAFRQTALDGSQQVVWDQAFCLLVAVN
jgi:hypothetical protein